MKSKVNILYVSFYSHIRMGGQKSMTHLIENLDREKYTPMCVVPEMGELSEKLESIDCKCFEVPLNKLKPKHFFSLIKQWRTIRKIVIDRQIDIIHPDSDRDAFICGLAKIGTKTKMAWHVRLTQANNLDRINEKLSDTIIGISDAVKKRFSDTPAVNKKYITIFNGVDCNTFSPIEDKSELRNKLGLPEGKFILVFVGQLKQGKGIYELAEAAALIRDEYGPDSMPIILFIGAPNSHEEEEKLKSIISMNHLDQNVRLEPQQENIHEWMQAANALILPSHEGVEGMGRVLFEAMACGLPVIGTDVSGINEAITSDTGLLVAEKSPGELADAVKKIVDNKDLQSAFSAAGRKRALAHFDIKEHARAVEGVYSDLLGV